MIKVFLCEDEFVVREGIKNNIDWAGNGYEFLGEASDGELALPLIRKLKPDVVITDIRMPFMDGLELSRIIRKELPDTEIVILSGYEEFDYAKQAISIGVAQYLTKPISGDDLLGELDGLREKITRNKEESALKEQFRKEMEENDRRDRSDLFRYLVSGSCTVTELIERAGKLGMDLSAVWYNIILLFIKSDHHEIEEYSKSSVTIEERIGEINDEMGCLCFDRDLEGKAILIMADSADALISKQNEVIERFRAVFADYGHVRYYGGIGKSVNRLSSLNESYEDAGRALANRFFASESAFFEAGQLSGRASGEDMFDMSAIDAKRIDKSNVSNFLKLGSRDEIPFYVGEFVKSVGEDAFNSYIFRQYIAMDVFFAVSGFVKELSGAKQADGIKEVTKDVLESVDGVRKYITSVIEDAISRRDSVATNRYMEIVDAAVDYIEEHFKDEDLSLNQLASHVNVSPNHLSTIFSQQTGQTFIKYLTEYRMNKAKEMLRCTSMRSSEISEAVGYKDPHYFSYMFKKTVGMTPTRYREGREADEFEG
ncbi:MAG: response regulator transcription factor [Lachnospiraceae bacterium]|nr:response regulator transcription factor [Lachnospiraceae bacterium]